ncbi:MAG: hypothetical protein ACOYN0_03595 [Phycisphaerales bacterium]
MSPTVKVRRRRGFILAFVLVLIMALSVLIVVMLQRQNAQMLAYKRQLEAYAMHHATAGFGEAIEAWQKNNVNTPVRQMIGPGGHIFDLTIEGGSPVRVSLFDAQGGALADLTGLSEEQILMGRELLMKLRDRLGADAVRYTRLDGPLAIGIRTAPQEVLLAAAEVALGSEGDPERLVELMMTARQDAGSDPIDINGVLTEAEIPIELRSRVVQLFAGETTLWRGTAELIEPAGSDRSREPLIYQFWANIRDRRRAGSSDSGLDSASSILRWERVQVPTYP